MSLRHIAEACTDAVITKAFRIEATITEASVSEAVRQGLDMSWEAFGLSWTTFGRCLRTVSDIVHTFIDASNVC